MSDTARKSVNHALTIFILLLMLAVLLFMVWPAHGSTSQLTGTLKDSFGNPLNGTLTLQLPAPATDTTTNTAVSNAPVRCSIVNGAIANCPPLYDVANLQPQNLYYIARAYDSSGTLVFNGNYPITGASYNLGAAVPTTVTTSNISYISPAATNQSNTFCCTQIFQGQIQSTVATGTAPFSIVSTTLVPNLNVQVLNGVTLTGTPSVGQVPIATSATAADWQNIPAVTSQYTNAGSPGTVLSELAKLTGAPSTVVLTTLTDTGGVVGICTGGCGTTGLSQISTVGQTSCVFDGATTASDYVQISATVVGDCHDVGASYPASGQVLGRVLSTNAALGTYTMTLFGTELQGATPKVTNQVFSTNNVGSIAVGTTNTTLSTLSVTMPASGCPCRVLISYSLYLGFSSNVQDIAFWVSDGTATYAGVETGTSNAAGGGDTSAAYGGYSTVTYANSANVTLTLIGIGTGLGGSVRGTPRVGSGPNSNFQAAIQTSN